MNTITPNSPIQAMKYSSRRSGNKNLWKDIKRYKIVYLLMLPALLCFLIFSYFPMTGIVMAFNEYKIGKGFSAIFTSPWVGLKHFKNFFESIYFSRVVGNTLIINSMKLLFSFPAPIIFAVLLNELRGNRFKKLVQTVSYLPSFLSTVVIYGLTLSVLSPSYGLLNTFRNQLGMNPIHYLAQQDIFRWILVVIDTWRYTGWDAIIYLAAIASIDQEMYEAAIIDGAGRFKRIWHITIPCISEIIFLMLILRIGNFMNGDFETVFLMYSPPVYATGDIIDTYVYRSGLVNSQYSFSAAVGLFKSVIGFILIMATNSIAKKFGKTGIW